jgi:hypothetical protein
MKSVTDLPIGAYIVPHIAAGMIPLGQGKWRLASDDGNSYPRSAVLNRVADDGACAAGSDAGSWHS